MKNLLIAFALLLVLSSASAFTVKSEFGAIPLTGDAVFWENGDAYNESYIKDNPAGKEGDDAYTLQTRHDPDKLPVMGERFPLNLSDGIESESLGEFVFTLERVWPKTIRKNGNCIGMVCSTRPKFEIVVKKDGGAYCGTGLTTFQQASSKLDCKSGSGAASGGLAFTVLNVSIPEYKETLLKVDGTRERWYLLRGENGIVAPGTDPGQLKEVTVDFCVSLRLEGEWSECVETRNGLQGLVDRLEAINAPKISGPDDASSVVDEIAGNTHNITGDVDSTITGTQGTIYSPDLDLERCDNEFNTVERELFITKTRFDYEKIGINATKDHSKWTKGMRDKWKGTEINLSGFREEQESYFSFFLDTHTPKLVSSNESGVVIEPKFHSTATTEPIEEQLKSWTGKQLNCGTAEKGLNEEGVCIASRTGNDDRITYRIYKFEAPYFRQATPPEKQDYGRDEILIEGPHCYDAWAYYEFKLDLADGDESWWISSKEELESFEQAQKDGWNLRLTTATTNGVGLEGVKVTVSGEVNGENWVVEGNTNANGIIEFIAPENVDLEIVASKGLYRSSETTINFEGQHEETILMHGDSYTMPLVFSRDDFWFLYFKVRPEFLEPKQAIGFFNIPEEKNARKAALDKSQFVIDEDKSNRLYAIVSDFYWWQEQPCDEGDSTRLEMTISGDFRTMTKTDYLGLSNKVYDVMLIQGLKYDGSYYSCGLVPKGNEINTREVSWNIDHEGNISPVGKRDI